MRKIAKPAGILALVAGIGAALPLALRSSTNRLPSSTIMILEQADHFELLSLDPKRENLAGKDNFHGYRILNRVPISEASTRQKLVRALMQGMRENSGTLAACFRPRHGIHATEKGRQADLVICFECLQIQLFGEAQGDFLVSHSPQQLFDASLQVSGRR